jgi:biopolymer transport protein ExbB
VWIASSASRRRHTTNLAIVAPGIAEALLATALGLVGAIRVFMIYNVLARSTAPYLGHLRRWRLGDALFFMRQPVSRADEVIE